MNYVRPTNQSFSTSKSIKRTTKMTETMRNQWAFANTHKVSIQVNPQTGEVRAQVKKR